MVYLMKPYSRSISIALSLVIGASPGINSSSLLPRVYETRVPLGFRTPKKKRCTKSEDPSGFVHLLCVRNQGTPCFSYTKIIGVRNPRTPRIPYTWCTKPGYPSGFVHQVYETRGGAPIERNSQFLEYSHSLKSHPKAQNSPQ
jgi:hypothetical protein